MEVPRESGLKELASPGARYDEPHRAVQVSDQTSAQIRATGAPEDGINDDGGEMKEAGKASTRTRTRPLRANGLLVDLPHRRHFNVSALAGDKFVASATSKEFVRTVLYKIGMLSAVQRMLGKKKPYLKHDNLTDRFESIYRTGVWQLGDKSVPLSGEGSSIEATENLRSRLPELLHSIGAKRLLDVGCGDFTWMSQVNLSGIDYVGAEIVPSVVQKSQQMYAGPGRAFIVANAVSDRLPSADAVLCREVLFHLSLEDGQKVLQNLLRTGATHFFLTTDIVTRVNSNIRSGDYRVLNLCAPPFKLPHPSVFIAEDASLPGRRLGVWTADELAKSLAQ